MTINTLVLPLMVLGEQMSISWPSDPKKLERLEYQLTFDPEKGQYTKTRYALVISSNEMNELNVDAYFENRDITIGMVDFSYTISLDDYKIQETGSDFYDDYYKNTKTELFLDPNIVGEPQNFRVDSTVVYAPYLKRDLSRGLKKVNEEFEFVGETTLDEFKENIGTYHYTHIFWWETAGIS